MPFQKENNLIFNHEIYVYKKSRTNLFSSSSFCCCWIRDGRKTGYEINISDPQHTGFGIELRETHLFAVDDLLPEVGLGQFDNILPLAGPGIAVAPTTAAAGTTFK